MTALSVRTALIVLTASSLAGCIEARSEYAPYAGYQPPSPTAPLRPEYPITEAQAPVEAARVAPPHAAPPAAAPAVAPAPARGVETQALPPVEDAPPARAQTSMVGGRSPMLTSLVWRSDADPVERIDAARHRRLRPEIDATPPPTTTRHRHARGDVQSATKSTHTIVVHKGDTIDSIAERLGTTPEAIIKANRLRHPRDLEVGRKLKVPTAKTYVVQPGDTLYGIGRRFDVPVDALKDLNGLESSARLQPGQKIDLPSQQAEPAPEAPPAKPARTRTSPPPSRRPTPPTPPTRPSSVAGSAFGGPSPETPVAPPPAPPPAAPAPVAPPASPSPPAPPAVSTSAAPSHPIPYTMLPGRASPPASPPPANPPPAYPPSGPTPVTPTGPITEIPSGPSDAQVAAAGRGRFAWPVQGGLLSGFGAKPGGQRNDGVDIGAPEGTPVRAAAAGDVVYAGNLVPGFGNLVLIKHEDGWVTAYAHLSRTEVKIRDHVAQGSEIGTVGTSGGVDQPQLHFEVRYAPSPRERARPVDPGLVMPPGQ
jgi:murein DD-endopeptidase MepM/ murein hydrolase activator NlpD